MEAKTKGKIISIKKQWWIKINTKPIRKHPLDGAIFPYIIKYTYTVDNKTYTKRQWLKAGTPIPQLNDQITIIYSIEKPSKSKIIDF